MEKLLGKEVTIMVEDMKGELYCDGKGTFMEDDYIFYRDMMDIHDMEYIIIREKRNNEYTLQIINVGSK